MQDPDLARLVAALDSVAEWVAERPERMPDLEQALATAGLRARCLAGRIGGGTAQESPYLAFVRKLAGLRRHVVPERMAAGG